MVHLVPYNQIIKTRIVLFTQFIKKIMLNSKIKNLSKLNFNKSIEFQKQITSNELDVNNCLFTPDLLTRLLRANKDMFTYFKHSSNKHSKTFKNKEGIYLITFRIVVKEKRILAYNYIYYNDLLYLTLIVYFLMRNYFILRDNHE
jgi:hypothetical protein